jgi:UPF0042 nucleotide-binding protein
MTTTQIILITGMSGAGKSVALRALEDAGCYCVDNLPPELLKRFLALERHHGTRRLAIAIDVRSAASLPLLPKKLEALRSAGVQITPLFLDATTDTLVRRFSETRHKHPLTRQATAGDAQDPKRALIEAIELERELLSDLRLVAHVIDTSMTRPAQLQSYVKALVSAPVSQMTLVFESFAFKRGIPLDADYLFDVRMLPNPHYEPALRGLTGLDAPVIAFLRQHEDVARMLRDIRQFLAPWLGPLAADNRSYVTVAIGCTGGQHRSVYIVEQLAAAFAKPWVALRRHRELESE